MCVYGVTRENTFLTVGHGQNVAKTLSESTEPLWIVSDQAGTQRSCPSQMVQCRALRTGAAEPSVCERACRAPGSPGFCSGREDRMDFGDSVEQNKGLGLAGRWSPTSFPVF